MRKTYIIIHHTASKRDTTVGQVDSWHEQRGFPISSLGYFIGYHYLIGDGWVLKTREPEEIGAHAYGWNHKAIGICMTGNFDNYAPSFKQNETLGRLMVSLMKIYNISKENVLLHRNVGSTACPGKYVTEEYINYLITKYMKVQNGYLYQLIENRGGFAVGVGSQMIVDDIAKILATHIMRCNGDIKGKQKTLNQKEWDSIPHYNLKGEVIENV